MKKSASPSFMSIASRMSKKSRTYALLTAVSLLAILLFLLLLSGKGDDYRYEIRVLNMCAIYTVLGLSMNLVNGYTGLFSLGQAGFMAIGAYVTTLLFMTPEAKNSVFYLEPIVPWLGNIQLPFPIALLMGGLASGVFAFFIGFPVLRLRGDYLAIATLGFSEIVRVIFTNLQTVTNGAVGIKNIPPVANLWWTFGIMILAVILMRRLLRTSYGRAFMAVRDDEVAAEGMGISLFKHKMFSFILSSILAGIGGGLLASVVGSINPLLFRFVLAYDILLIVVLGGLGSISGTIVGAFIITIAKEWLRWLDNGFSLGIVQIPEIAGLRMVIFSLLLMCVILFYRKGLFGSREFSWAACGRILKAAGLIATKPFRPVKKGGEK
jgi:branched-chain amino acid transport system permease protein